MLQRNAASPRSVTVRTRAWLAFAGGVCCLVALAHVTAADAPPKKKKGETTPSPSHATAEPADVSEFQRAARGSRKLPATTITNEDLERMFGPPTPQSEGEPVAAPVEPTEAAPGAATGEEAGKSALEAMAEQEQERSQRERDVAAATTKVGELRKRIDELDQRARAVRNPLLPRPSVPEEQQGEWSKLGAAERAARTDAELDLARSELASAEQELARLKSPQP